MIVWLSIREYPNRRFNFHLYCFFFSLNIFKLVEIACQIENTSDRFEEKKNAFLPSKWMEIPKGIEQLKSITWIEPTSDVSFFLFLLQFLTFLLFYCTIYFPKNINWIIFWSSEWQRKKNKILQKNSMMYEYNHARKSQTLCSATFIA